MSRGREPPGRQAGLSVSQEAIAAAFALHLPSVYRYLYARVHNAADAEDLCSEVFLKAVRWLDPTRSPGEARTWLLRTAATVLAEHWRAHYRQAAVVRAIAAEPRSAPPAADAGRAESQVHAILARIPSRYREVLALRFLEGLSPKEIGERMRLRPDHVRVLQYRALRAAASSGRSSDGDGA